MRAELFLLEPEGEEFGWQDRALCAQTDPEAFFPEKGGSTREAKKVCLTCEVRDDCLEYAWMTDERFGIWGGLSERERRKLKKMARMVAEGVMTAEQAEQSYQSWRGGLKRLDAHRTVRTMDALYRSLFENLAGGGLLNAIQAWRRHGWEHAPTLATEGATHDGTGNRRGDQRLQTAA